MSFVNGFAFQSSTYIEKGPYKIITIKNVQDGDVCSHGASCVEQIPLRMSKECELYVGDVLLSLTGNVGRVGIVYENNLLLNQRVAKIVPYDKIVLPLLYFWFRLPETKSTMEMIAKGTAQQNLSPIETLKLSIPFNQSSAIKLSKALKPLFDSIVSNLQQNLYLSDLRDTLLPKLMSGEIDVSEVEI